MKLSQLKQGESGIVGEISEKCNIRERLWDMGLVRGTETVMLYSAPFGGPVEIALRGYRLVLRREDAANVDVVRR